MTKTPILEIRNLSKRFGSVWANQNISLSIETGTIHALIGENGAGKSTLVKMIFGLYSPDQGEIFFKSRPSTWKNSSEAMKSGLGMVHQHFMLADPNSVLDNLILHRSTTTPLFKKLNREALRKEYSSLAEQYGMEIPLDEKIENCSVGVQQRVEILKVLQNQSDLIILDEPTAVLTPQEIADFFSVLKRLKKEGKTIVIITHKLKEVMSLADTVTVIRHGKVVGGVAVAETSTTDLAAMMVGRKIEIGTPAPLAAQVSTEFLKVENLSYTSEGREVLKDISFSVRKGEILGVAGVEGNGQSELLKSIVHPQALHEGLRGKVSINGRESTKLSSQEIRKLGVSYLPQDRLKQGLLMSEDLIHNYLLTHLHKVSLTRFGIFNWKIIRQIVTDIIQKFDVRPAEAQLPAQSLSGGNQQKFVVGREMLERPTLLVAAQPTRGVDIGAIEFIHQQIVLARDAGSAVLLVSSELDELLKLSDRLLVIFRGEIVAEFTKGQFDEIQIGRRMGGSL